jgi:hypothetical protein
MTLDTKEKNTVDITIQQDKATKGGSNFPLSLMLSGKDGMSYYQVVPDFKLGGKAQTITIQIPEIGDLKCIHLRTYEDKKVTQKLNIDEITVLEQDHGGKKTVFKNGTSKLMLSQKLRDIDLCAGEDDKPFEAPPDLPDQEDGTPLGAGDLSGASSVK